MFIWGIPQRFIVSLKTSETWIQKPAVLLGKLHVSPTLAKSLVEQGENGALPEGVAAVHQFIGAPLEAALVGHLLVDRPLQETWGRLILERTFPERKKGTVDICGIDLSNRFPNLGGFTIGLCPSIYIYIDR